MCTVKENFGLCCPACGSDERLEVIATVAVAIMPDGVEQSGYGGFEWEDESPIVCDGCGWEGTVVEAEAS